MDQIFKKYDNTIKNKSRCTYITQNSQIPYIKWNRIFLFPSLNMIIPSTSPINVYIRPQTRIIPNLGSCYALYAPPPSKIRDKGTLHAESLRRTANQKPLKNKLNALGANSVSTYLARFISFTYTRCSRMSSQPCS